MHLVTLATPGGRVAQRSATALGQLTVPEEPLMQIFALVASLALTLAALFVLVPAVRRMLRVIRMGRPASPSRTDQPVARTVTMLKETVLHTRMLQWTWVGVMHWFVFAAFLFLSTAVAGAYFQLFDPEWAWPIVGRWYPFEWFSEFIGALSTVGVIWLIVYRQKHHPRSEGRRSRFFGSTFWQAYFVEYLALLEGAAILFIRGAEFHLADPEHATRAHFPLASWLGDALYPAGQGTNENLVLFIAFFKIALAMVWLVVIGRNLTMGIAWHRFTAWFNIWFKRESSGRTALGALKPLAVDGKAVTLDDVDDLDEDARLGVGAIEDFSWKGLLDFTTCTECGRCQSQCPAWNTQKPLSPKLLMKGLREHTYLKAAGLAGHVDRALIGKGDAGGEAYNPEGGDFVVDADVLWSCTTCGACVEQCPVDIEHVDHIVDMRRYQVLIESDFPAELNQVFKGLESRGNPWNMAASARMDWAKGLPFEVKEVGKDLQSLESVDWLFWVGCAGAYEDRAKKTTRAVAELLHMAGVSFGVLGNRETCTGDSARRSGNEFVYQALAQENVETFKEFKVKKVVATCAHCFNTLKNEYKAFGIELEVVHHTQLLNRLVREGRLTPVAPEAGASKRSITYHDPCYLGRHNQVYSPPRELLQALPGASYVEMERNSERSFCCGAGGARMWMEESLGERINMNRSTEAVGTGADRIVVGCPFCRVMLSDGVTALQAKSEAREDVEVLDVAQMLLASVRGEPATEAQKAPAGAPPAAPASAAVPAAPAAAEPAASGSSLFAEAPAKPVSGGSLFDEPTAEPAPAPANSSGSLFDQPTAEPTPTPANSSNSLFDQPTAEPTPTPANSSNSLFDQPTAEPTPTPANSSNSLFDQPTAEPTPTPADSGGSLFDVEEALVAQPEPEQHQAPEKPKGLFDL
ncbi:heterodisulfide reductase-related iron-sulfur binding cluster [Streptomyces sp. Li-HN-5-11]|uniref:heterodisulfide reductase-related iron-sulfur binding cluster n=1 Tax=Streptomyces sp. Li-HN-5-11 TaxID=3075432 RepID=UPI0028A67FB6|nr:heterodisulfide reductase-related iron-sulfur binding cluster [Streptomyces sp. Li-HN-5-11]WNM32162.1 heterodisulfide reductase-related iron-sulfur binding cluster [Streptomyces sp. Li-HN-5-11]